MEDPSQPKSGRRLRHSFLPNDRTASGVEGIDVGVAAASSKPQSSSICLFPEAIPNAEHGQAATSSAIQLDIQSLTALLGYDAVFGNANADIVSAAQ